MLYSTNPKKKSHPKAKNGISKSVSSDDADEESMNTNLIKREE